MPYRYLGEAVLTSKPWFSVRLVVRLRTKMNCMLSRPVVRLARGLARLMEDIILAEFEDRIKACVLSYLLQVIGYFVVVVGFREPGLE